MDTTDSRRQDAIQKYSDLMTEYSNAPRINFDEMSTEEIEWKYRDVLNDLGLCDESTMTYVHWNEIKEELNRVTIKLSRRRNVLTRLYLMSVWKPENVGSFDEDKSTPELEIIHERANEKFENTELMINPGQIEDKVRLAEIVDSSITMFSSVLKDTDMSAVLQEYYSRMTAYVDSTSIFDDDTMKLWKTMSSNIQEMHKCEKLDTSERILKNLSETLNSLVRSADVKSIKHVEAISGLNLDSLRQ